MSLFTGRNSSLRCESRPLPKAFRGLLSQLSGRVFGTLIAACWVGPKAQRSHFELS